MGGAGDEGEEVGVGDAEDVVELEVGSEAESVEEGGHYLGVVFWWSYGQFRGLFGLFDGFCGTDWDEVFLLCGGHVACVGFVGGHN